MDNLQIMDMGIKFTNEMYIREYFCKINGRYRYKNLEEDAILYSGILLMQSMFSMEGELPYYTRTNNLRRNMASIGKENMKKELLKNAINVGIYLRKEGINYSSTSFFPGMKRETMALAVLNNVVQGGPEKGYELLDDLQVIIGLCNLFADYRREGKKEVIDEIANKNVLARSLNEEIDIYHSLYSRKRKMFVLK